LSVDDAVQDVFLECFRPEGALARLDRDGSGTFRTFLFAVTRNVARRHEEQTLRRREAPASPSGSLGAIPADADTMSQVFDRRWALAMLARARDRHAAMAAEDGEDGRRRQEVLRMRFEENLPIREIAQRWDMDPAVLHAEYRRARDEFKRALREEVSFHQPDSTEAIDGECLRLLALVKSDRR